MNPIRNTLALAAALAATGLGVRPALSLESVVVRIDNTVVQPISTGLVFPYVGNLIFITEGNLQPFVVGSRLTAGNFGADGETRLQRAGQPIVDGMPYGALVGRIGSGTIPNFQFLGATGVDRISSSDVGSELRLALNMSDADLAGMDGELVVTAIFVAEGSQEVAEIELDAASAHPTPTGLIAASGDTYIVLSSGTVRHATAAHDGIVDGWFGPAGRVMFNRAGQPASEGPFGAVYGTYSVPTAGFYLGSAGSWQVQPADIGNELSVFLNMSAADQATVEGSLKVWVARIPEVPSSADEIPGSAESAAFGYPNPTSGPARIRYAVPADGDVLVRIHDAAGRVVTTLVDAPMRAGVHEVEWSAAGAEARIASGTYFYQVTTRSGTNVGRIVVAK